MPSSLYSLLVFSHSVLGYDLNWVKEAEILAQANADSRGDAQEAREAESFIGL